ncbi:MAG: amino acid permease [Planctomycetota bacterium]
MKGGRFGTFGGVFTPCTLTILGVIMFLRFGQVVGQAGVWYALSIVALAKLITTLTTLSLSAIATNTRVKGGGAYYLISRSLGVEFGGSIGVIFFLAQAVSVSLYVIGFTEVLFSAFPGVQLDVTVVATVVNLVVFVCVMIGAGWAIKIQYGVLAVLGISLLSFFVGAILKADGEVLRQNLGTDYAEGSGYWTMFALFFPAATGIMAGANMSGDLKNPARSIPKGTLWSVLVTGLVYLGMAVALGASADRETLHQEAFVVKSIALVGLLVTLGVFAATFSSAVGSLMGAPRILQALARDEIFRPFSFFGAGSGPNDEPRRAIVLTFLIAQGGVMLGDLDLIAPIITMFFMITYGYLNLATFYESITKNPSYRPRFRFSHWSTALLGTVGCGAVMILISPLWALAAIAATAALHRYLERQNMIATWGDLKSGAAFERARKSLLKLEEEKYHPKNWRPSVLALGGGDRRQHLAVYGNWLTVGRGLLTLAQIIPGDSDTHLRRRAQEEESLRAFVRDAELEAFTAVLVAPKLSLGIEALVQCYGIGALRPNVLLLGWLTDPKKREDWGIALRTIKELGRSIVLMRAEPDDVDDPWDLSYGSVDVWWRGMVNGALMLLLAHLLAANPAWRGKRVRLLRVIGDEAGREEATEHLQQLIEEARIEATPVIVVADDPAAAIREASADASIVLLGFEPPKAGAEQNFVDGMNGLMEGLGTTLLIWSSGDVRLEA